VGLAQEAAPCMGDPIAHANVHELGALEKCDFYAPTRSALAPCRIPPHAVWAGPLALTWLAIFFRFFLLLFCSFFFSLFSFPLFLFDFFSYAIFKKCLDLIFCSNIEIHLNYEICLNFEICSNFKIHLNYKIGSNFGNFTNFEICSQ
jgi:hypothetical protein